MKKLALAAAAVFALLTGSASAADMAVKAPVVPPVPVFSWTGFYIGVHGGGAWYDKDWDAPLSAINIVGGCAGCPRPISSNTASSWLAGGQIGFNYQTGIWVWGVEADASATDLKGSGSNGFFAPGFLLNNSEIDSLGTIAGRVGVTANQALFYVKGGGAWAHDRFFTSFGAAPGIALQASSDTRWGWMVGVGVEYAFTPNWSVKAEYNHMDFGSFRQTLNPQLGCGCVAFQYDINQTVDLVKVGVNYRFGWGGGPVVAKY